MTYWTVEVENLDETIKALNEFDKKAGAELKKRIREIAKPTLAKARTYGHVGSWSTGKYASSLSLKTWTNGVKFISSDPGAGVIEFANPGAIILDGVRAGRRAGVPHGSTPPRALLRAILEDEESIIEKVNEAVQDLADFVI